MALVSPATVRREVDATDRAIRAAGWRGPILFRPPYGIKLLALPWHLWRAGRTTMTWDVEPDSYPTVAATPARIVAHVLARVRPGSVVLLHPWYASRATSLAAVGPLVDSLHARGYRVTTAGELLAHASTRARAATHRPQRRSPRGRVSGTTAPQHPPTPSLSLPPMMMQHVHPPVPPPALAAVHAQIGRLEADNRTLRRQRRVAVVHLAPRTTEP
jgi:hypothetical protein